MSVSAIIVTRGDVELGPILQSLPASWQKIVWDNGAGVCRRWSINEGDLASDVSDVSDLSVYGRYAAIQYASHDLIYVQDDDCIVENPGSIVDAWYREDARRTTGNGTMESPLEFLENHLVANMPLEFRAHYPDSCLVGFGACFHRDLPARAFKKFFSTEVMVEALTDLGFVNTSSFVTHDLRATKAELLRTSDVVFTTLTPRVLVDVPVEVLPYAHDRNRMWQQPDHFGERMKVLAMARKVRDA